MTKLEVLAIPVYFGTMGAEYAHHRPRLPEAGPLPGDYERRDTLTSLTMGTASLLVPLVAPTILGPITPGKGRYGKALVAGALGAIAVTTVADVAARRAEAELAADEERSIHELNVDAGPDRRRPRPAAAPVGAAPASPARSPASAESPRSPSAAPRSPPPGRTSPDRARCGDAGERFDLGTGVAAWTAAIVGWDLIYYWNHRVWHETRFMWANHVMHHSSERYNLSTALRQSVTDPWLFLVPYSLLSLAGVRPELVASSRSINLLYQYWVHTDAIDRLGPAEELANTPSHHRVHHGVNPEYIDRNHGGILILWDRLFGTFRREDDEVVYGLTKNIDTFNPLRVAAHEYYEMFRDVAGSTTWRERLSYVLRGPGWAYERRRGKPSGS